MMCLSFFWLQLQTPKAHGVPAKGKGKQTWDDDVPPATPLDMADEVAHLRDLQDYLLCATHSKPGTKTYCWVEVVQDGIKGGHRELSHSELTLWDKYIMSHASEHNE